jgi:hypothetical protein
LQPTSQSFGKSSSIVFNDTPVWLCLSSLEGSGEGIFSPFFGLPLERFGVLSFWGLFDSFLAGLSLASIDVESMLE